MKPTETRLKFEKIFDIIKIYRKYFGILDNIFTFLNFFNIIKLENRGEILGRY